MVSTKGAVLNECVEYNGMASQKLFSKSFISIMHSIVKTFHTLCSYEHSCVCMRVSMHAQMHENVCTCVHAPGQVCGCVHMRVGVFTWV